MIVKDLLGHYSGYDKNIKLVVHDLVLGVVSEPMTSDEVVEKFGARKLAHWYVYTDADSKTFTTAYYIRVVLERVK